MCTMNIHKDPRGIDNDAIELLRSLNALRKNRGLKFIELLERVPGLHPGVLSKFINGKLPSIPERHLIALCRELGASYDLQRELVRRFVNTRESDDMLEYFRDHGRNSSMRSVWIIAQRFPMANEDPAIVQVFIENIVHGVTYVLFSSDEFALRRVLWRIECFFRESDIDAREELRTCWLDATEQGRLQCIVGPPSLRMASYSIQNPLEGARIDYLEFLGQMPVRPVSLHFSCATEVVRFLEPFYMALTMGGKDEYEGFRRIFPVPKTSP